MSYSEACATLAAELVKAHDRSGSGSVAVVPVIVDDLDRAMPLVEFVKHLTGGLVIDTSDLTSPFQMTNDPIRRAAWSAGLDLSSSASTRRVVLRTAPSGLTDAEFDGSTTGGVLSPGDKTILGIVRAAVHGDLDDADTAVILYREGSLDLPARRAAWRALVERFLDIPHATLKTLIVIVEAAIDVQLHCRRRLGFRFALDSGRLLRRRGSDDLSAIAGMVARQPGPVAFFLGAGFSASSRLPLGNGLRDSAIARLLGISDTLRIPSEELASRFYDWIRDRPNWMSQSEKQLTRLEYTTALTLEQVVRAEVSFFGGTSPTLLEFKDHHDKVVMNPGPAVLDLARILENGSGRVILTSVNFDRLVEEHCPVPLRVFATDSEFASAAAYIVDYIGGRETDIPLLKLHGTIDQPETCVVSAEQTERGIGASKLTALRALLGSPPRFWFYVGASMRDLDLLPVLGEESFARGLNERWVAPFLADTVEAFGLRREAYWATTQFKDIQDRMITETADEFFAALSLAWCT